MVEKCALNCNVEFEMQERKKAAAIAATIKTAEAEAMSQMLIYSEPPLCKRRTPFNLTM